MSVVFSMFVQVFVLFSVVVLFSFVSCQPIGWEDWMFCTSEEIGWEDSVWNDL